MSRLVALAPGVVLLHGAQGCARTLVLEPRGRNAALLEDLWWAMFWSTGISAAVVAALLVAAVSARRRVGEPSTKKRDLAFILIGGAALPTFVLVFLVVQTVQVGAEVVRAPEPPALTIDVVGHRYWFEVRYPDHGVVTANEIYIPVGRVVRFRLYSADVIHSFWVPQLAGKRDMTPGIENELWLRADAPGAYRGFCTEFCGEQHALMGFWIFAVEPEELGRFLDEQRRPALPSGAEGRGAAVFLAARCHLCHAVRGVTGDRTYAAAGPDLTHVGTRRTLLAATLENTPENLAQVILNPHVYKPGVRMPATPLEDDEVRALVGWLGSLR